MLVIFKLKFYSSYLGCSRGGKARVLAKLAPVITLGVNVVPCLEIRVRELVRRNTDNRAVFLVQLMDLPGKSTAE